MPTRVVTFDAGQTLVELDLDFLATRLAERGIAVDPGSFCTAAAWRRYDARLDAGERDTRALWCGLIADVTGGAADAAAVDWLWSQQPVVNLFKRPIADMVALARVLRAEGVRVAIVSNSEGGLEALLGEIGIADAFEVVIDSARVGIEKPDPRIFELALRKLGVVGELDAVHIGDSYPADIAGALGAGWRAVWYGRRAQPVDDVRVASGHSAAEVRAALDRFWR